MRSIEVAPILMLMLALSGARAFAADDAKGPVTVIYKDGKTLELTSLEIGTEDAGLFGTSFRARTKLPVNTEELRLEVPMKNLRTIEVLSADKEGKNVKVKLTALDGKTLEGTIDSEPPVIWKGTVPFAESEATLDLTVIKEIILRPEKK